MIKLKNISITFIFMILFCFIHKNLLYAEQYNIHDTPWGITKEKIKYIKKSNSLIYETTDYIQYSTNITKYTCFVFYFFKNNKLQSITYMFTPTSQQESEQIYVELITNINKIYTKYIITHDQNINNNIFIKLYETLDTNIIIANAYKTRESVILMYFDGTKYTNSEVFSFFSQYIDTGTENVHRNTGDQKYEDKYDVRKVRWGMSLEEIKDSENAPMFGKPEYSKFSHETTMRYRDKFFGVWCDIEYNYNPTIGLYNVIYYSVPQSYNETKKIFNTISDSLSEKYVNIDNSRQLLYTPVHTFINDRTAITLSRNSAGPLERIVLNYYSMTYWNKLHENSEEDENRREQAAKEAIETLRREAQRRKAQEE